MGPAARSARMLLRGPPGLWGSQARGDVAVERRGPGSELSRVGEKVVRKVFGGLPARPLQGAGLALPRVRGRAAEGGDGEPHGLVEVVSGHGAFS